MKESTPKGMRLHIGLFGRRNVGKSSLLNAVVRQQVSIVSKHAGTTTDPVDKAMELLPIGPVLFIDTAGIDDDGTLGQLRVGKTRKAIERTDVGVIISDGPWGEFEEHLHAELTTRDVPVIAVLNKADLHPPSAELLDRLTVRGMAVVVVSTTTGRGLENFRAALLAAAPAEFIDSPAIAGDLLEPGQTAVLVVPIDMEAPKGRLILPQVQTIRDLLDTDAMCMIVTERELPRAIANLKHPPALVITDSQAFSTVAAATPADIPMTSFSILFARFKGDLITQTLGALAVERLKPGDHVLIAEACSHHPIGEDIGRVKIPRWLNGYAGGPLHITTVQGQDFPDDLAPFDLVIHCGACMWNRRLMLNRILACRRANVPISNYGLVIAYSLGIFERALSPFPAALQAYCSAGKPSP